MLLLEEGKDYDNVEDGQLPYKHLKNLGHGHSGVVEEVQDRVTKEVYARKSIWLPRLNTGRRERTEVFRNEVKIIRNLGNHRHIIKVFATYMTKRHVGLILQPVASDGDLEGFIADYCSVVRDLTSADASTVYIEKSMPVLERAFGCLAMALAFIHEKKIRHKDIKPKNILVHDGNVIYTDFGYSFDSSAFNQSTTEGRPNALTRKYSAPEVLDHRKRNSKSDVFSLGCVFIDMLAALVQRIDFDKIASYSTSMSEIHDQISSWKPSPRHEFLFNIITRMTTPATSERSTAADVASQIIPEFGFSCSECTLIVQRERVSGGPEEKELYAMKEDNTGIQEISRDVSQQNTRGNTLQSQTICTPNSESYTKGYAIQIDLSDDWSRMPPGATPPVVSNDIDSYNVSPQASAINRPIFKDANINKWSAWSWSEDHRDYYCTLVEPDGQVHYTFSRQLKSSQELSHSTFSAQQDKDEAKLHDYHVGIYNPYHEFLADNDSYNLLKRGNEALQKFKEDCSWPSSSTVNS